MTEPINRKPWRLCRVRAKWRFVSLVERYRSAGVLIAMIASILGSVGSAEADPNHFGCSTSENRTIAATAYFRSDGSGFWKVTKIDYSYSNSGGGHANTSFTIYNGADAAAWTWGTPDDRGNQDYTKPVKPKRGGLTIARGTAARAFQRTWFDVFGHDPSCTKNGYF